MQHSSSSINKGSQTDHQVVFNALQGNFLLLQPNPPLFTILAVSDEHLQITGHQREDVIGKNVFDAYPENPEVSTSIGPSSLKISLQNVLDNKIPDQMPVLRYDLVNSDGEFEERYWRTTNKPVLDSEGNILYILHSTSEITEQIMAEKKASALRTLEKKYNIFMQAPVAVCIVKGPENTVELANEEMLKIIGRSSEIIGKPLLDSFPEAAGLGFPELLDRVRKAREPIHATEFSVSFKKDGKEELRYYNIVYQPYFENAADTEAAGVFSVAHDVTELVQVRRKVEESELQVRSFIESSHHPIGVYTGREMRIQFANQALKDGLGKGNDIVGKLYKDVLPELENQQVFEQLEAVYTTGIPFQAKNHRLDLEIAGELQTHYFDLSFTPLFNTSGEVYGVINTGADVTELNLARELVAESEARYRSLIEEAPIATALYLGKDIRIRYANKIMLSYWDKDTSVVGKTFREALPELEDQPFPSLLNEVYETGRPYIGQKERADLLVDGQLQTFYFNFTYKPLFNEGGEVYGIHHTAIDVTEEVQALRKVAESIRDLKHMADAMPQLVWIANPDGSVIYYNERIKEFAGARREGDGWHWESMVLEEDEQRTVDAWNEAVGNGTLYEIEHRVKMKDGSYRWHLSRALPQKDSGDRVVKWFGTATDVHERKKDQQALEVNNVNLKRINNDLDNFIYTASHDLKAPISNIEGLVELLSDEYSISGGKNSDTDMMLNLMKESVYRFKKTINSLTDVAKLQQEHEFNSVLVDVAEVIEEVIFDLTPLINSANASLHVDVADSTSIRFSDKNLRSVIYNLLPNSIKYSSPERLPQIQISCQVSGNYHVLSVKDNGLGMSPNQTSALFTMFKRFHDHVEGTGIGLYMVKKIVENGNGKIEVESEENVGSTFRVYLPTEG